MTTHLLAVVGRGLVDPADPILTVDDQALQRGDGVFETVLVVTDSDGGSRAVNLTGHLARLARGEAALDLQPTPEHVWHAEVDRVLAAWTHPGEAALKLFRTRGTVHDDGGSTPTCLVALSPLAPGVARQRVDGIAVVALTLGRRHDAHETAPWLLGGVKTISYAVNMAAIREAVRRGADDLVFTSSDGWVLEAPTSSVVWWVDGQLRTTPHGASGVLAGTTQLALFAAAESAGLGTGYQFGSVADLTRSQAVWLVSSVRGVTPVRTLDGVDLAQRPDLVASFQSVVYGGAALV